MAKPLTEQPLARLRPLAPSEPMSESETPQSQLSTRPLSRINPLPRERNLRILDFDLETLAAGFADPNWVPQKITCAAWSWIGEDRVHSRITGKGGFFNAKLRVSRLAPLIDAIAEADIVTGHNLIRFDLPVLNAELMRGGVEPLERLRVQDTMKLPKSKGFKKGQDNLSGVLGTAADKQAMTWFEWDEAYEDRFWREVISRCESDVIQHKQMRGKILDAGWGLKTIEWKAK